MLSPDEKAEIEAEAAHYPDKRAACIEALKIVQSRRRWISDESLKEIAALLEMTAEELDGVASFYNLIYRRPVGENVILLCDSVSCWIMGHQKIEAHLCSRLGIRPGETTKDGRWTVLPVPCLGTCERAPVMLVGEEVAVELTPAKIDEILSRKR